ncbi:Guanosine-3',5'-bis(diphosphate) 3'-pyrophosphohydrolase MESH1 [Anabarilius grahami]|uniref:Guanosine-3',5'-bis(Diphosphate) 3'-pyrophosphohydrolase MESH1 n=1 Tax=Anabarilius grahami TaxID=495550 RepID=A0A3N0YCM1_ANAGA|nr:Guanosine-3',5'-bis(diphosphate) 3'-pyrophosphohydrolase MESH1 [Anabarilius grahami]
MSSSSTAVLLETINFAAEKHRNQRRKDPDATPYINHPIGWTAERVQEYFVWASRVTKGLRGTNAALEEKLQLLFLERGVEF